MPLTHFLDDEARPISFDDAIRLALETPGGFLGTYPAPMLAAMVPDDSRKHAGISASMLGGCERKAFFDLTLDYGSHPSKLWAALRGTAMHAIFEKAEVAGVTAERRIGRRTSHGLLVTGKFDHLEIGSGRLYDYKSKEKVPEGVPYGYEIQLNTYRWLLQAPQDVVTGEVLEPVPVEALYLIFFTMKEVAPARLVRVWAEGEWERRVQPIAEAIAAASLDGEWPEREVPFPAASPFCQGYCPHLTTCLRRN